MTLLGAVLAVALAIGALASSLALRGRRDLAAELWPSAFALWASVTLSELVAARSGVRLDSAGVLLAPSAGALAALFVLLVPARFRSAAAATAVGVLTLLGVANVLFFRQFGGALPAEMLLRAGDAWRVRDSAIALLSLDDLWLAVPVLAALGVVMLCDRPRDAAPWRPAVVLGCAAIGLPALVFSLRDGLRRTDPGNHPLHALRSGYLVAQLSDLCAAIGERRSEPDPERLEAARAVVAARAEKRSRAHGAARGASVILIQVESLNAWVLDAKIGERPVAPALGALASRGVLFPRVLDQTGPGRTSDADHLVLVSQHPLPRAPIATVAVENELVALPSVLARTGYETALLTADPRGLWSIARRAARYGFERALFAEDLGPGERIGFFHGDRVVFERAAELCERLPQPFLLRVSTMSMHSPHAPLPEPLDTLELGALEGTPLGNYLDAVAYFDRALSAFVTRLQQIAPGALIVVYGDHGESHGFDSAAIRAISGHALERPARVPLIFVHPVVAEHTPRAEIAGLIDVAPSIVDLLGIERPRSFLGTTIFGNGPDFVARWDGFVEGNELWSGAECRARRSGTRLEDRACDALREQADNELQASWFLTREHVIPSFAKLE